MITDRMRFSVVEVNTNKILSRDLVAKEWQVTVNLSAPTQTNMTIDGSQRYGSAGGIKFKNWGQWIIPEIETDQFGKICFGGPIVSNNKIDAATGNMILDGLGFMGYPKGIPFLDNLMPIAIDPAEVFQRFWAHAQNYVNAQLGVEVLPASTGTQMLPGFGFNGSIFSIDFYALFVSAADFVDIGDFLTALARDLPLDLFEEVSWNADRTELIKVLRLAYPLGGVKQDFLSFRLGENVTNAEKAEEFEIEPVSDVIIRSWIPGRVYSSRLSNNDMTRLRRVIMEEDANISNNERAAAWAKRKLTRRNVPDHFKKITVLLDHPNAPFGSYWVGDSIFVEAKDYPWVGDISEWHRIISITMKNDEPTVELTLKADGAFNYDPIIYDPAPEEPPEDPNLLVNGYFTKSLTGWKAKKGQWIRVATSGFTGDGCVRIDCDDNGEEFESQRVGVNEGQTYDITAAVRAQTVTAATERDYVFAIRVNHYLDGGKISDVIVDSENQIGTQPYRVLQGPVTIPAGINEISLSLVVNNAVSGGVAFWDDARILP